MRVAEFLRYFPECLVSREQMAYANYLERMGMTFLIDFGLENAEGMAWERLEQGEFILGHA